MPKRMWAPCERCGHGPPCHLASKCLGLHLKTVWPVCASFVPDDRDDLLAQLRKLPRNVRADVVANVKARAADLIDEAKESGKNAEEMRGALMLTARFLQKVLFQENA